jgi:co-chaperonin GroES (HSP10)
MFYAAGDIILIDRLCGREVVLGAKNKKYVLVNQVDVLCKFEGVTLADIEVE